MSTSPGELDGSVSVAVTDQSWTLDAVSTCGPCPPVHGSWLTPSRSGDDCCPAANPGAWPEDAPAFQDPQPLTLDDALPGQLSVNAPPANTGIDAVGAAADADCVGVGLAFATEGPVFVTLGILARIPVEIATGEPADWGEVLTVGEPLPVGAAAPQPAAAPMMTGRRAEAPITLRVRSRMPVLIASIP